MPRPERSFRTQAIVLKRRDFGEADRLLTLLTPHHGKVEAIAKGARKPTSAKSGHVELFALTDVLIHRGRNFGILTQAELVEPYLMMREDLQRGAYASYVAELIDRFMAMDDDGQTELFALVKETLARLCDDTDPRLAVRYYEMRLLDAVGFRPELNECVISHEIILPEDQYFSFSEGGVVSPGYAHLSEGLVPITMTTLKLLRHLQRSPYARVKSLGIHAALHNDIERIILAYLTYILEQKLQSVDFIRRIRH